MVKMVKINLETNIPTHLKNILGKKITKNTIEIQNDSITICYANNGTGKTTLANEILSNTTLNGGREISVFSYGDNIDYDKEQFWTIGESIKEINDLNKNLINKYSIIEKDINGFFKKLDIFPGKDIYKRHLKNKQIFGIDFSKIIIAAKSKSSDILMKEVNISDFLESMKNDLNNVDEDFIFSDAKKILEDEYYLSIKNLVIRITKILKSIFEKYSIFVEGIKEYFKNNKININILELSRIDEILEKIEEMQSCYICDSKIIDFNKIKEGVKNKILFYNQEIEKYLEIKEIEDIISEIPELVNENSPLYTYIKKIKAIKNNIINIDFLKTIYDDFLKINNIEENFMGYLKLELASDILKDSLIKEKLSIIQNEKNILYSLIVEENKIIELEKNKTKISEDEFNFIIDILDDYVGKGRITFDELSSKLMFDGKNDCNENSFSTGELNFIAFAFSLLLESQKIKEKKIDIVCFDDPITSFDSNYKFFVLYLLNYFAKEKSMPILVLTHSYEVISIQEKSGFKTGKYYFIKTLSSEVIDDEELGFHLLTKNEIKNISFKHSVEFIVEEIKLLLKEPNNIELISKLIYSFLPMLRALAYLVNDKTSKNVFSELMHYRKINEINNLLFEDFYEALKKYLNNELCEKTFRKIFEKIKFNSLNENFGNMFDIKMPKSKELNIIEKSLMIFLKSIHLRKLIEKKCLDKEENYSEFIDPSIKSNMRAIINNSSLSNEDKTKLKCSRLIIQDNLHMEGHLNLVSPGLEYGKKWFGSQEKIIMDIINRTSHE